MVRRTKKEMEYMTNFVTLDLLAHKLDPHMAYESMIKDHLQEGKSIPHYVKGIKDYIKVSKELKLKFNQNKQKEESKNKLEELKHDIEQLTLEEIKAIYKENKNKVDQAHKIALHDLYLMIFHNDIKVTNEHINAFTFNKIEIKQYKKAS